jgi:methionyl aminopeptidase
VIAATTEDIEALKKIGRIVALALQKMQAETQPGMTTAELDQLGADFMRSHGARSAPQLVYNFPGFSCISVNDETVHGVPGDRVINPGDLVTVDVTAELDGYMADSALTITVPPVSPLAERLCRCTQSALRKAIATAQAGKKLNRIGQVVEAEVRRHGFTVIRQLTGHGLGRTIHEAPTVPNFYHPKFNQPLPSGLVLAIEPIISSGSEAILTNPDGWTVRTADGSLSAHFEHTLIITSNGPLVITQI